jgi:Amt family ammonium transporter
MMNALNWKHLQTPLNGTTLLVFGWIFLAGSSLQAEAEATAMIDTGDTAWMIVATVLVLFMTLPGLALFYGGLVRAKNVLSVLMQCFVIAAVMTVLWIVYGYSLATQEGSAFIGDLGKAFLQGVGVDSVSGTIPETVFVTFQMTFAIITPALIVGAFAERMKFTAVLLFTAIWFTLSYVPIWHMAWGGGLFGAWGVLDFAGGTVVHINAGIAGLVACILCGPRKGHHPKIAMTPHSVPLTVVGACMLWVGWFGFNAGSELASDGVAGMALLVTQVATAAAVLSWMVAEWLVSGKPTAVGAATGAVAGLVAVTPASGTCGPMGALLIGIASGLFCYFFATSVKRALGYDDSLDVFGVHGIGGIVGALLTGVCAGALGGAGLGEGVSIVGQVWIQLKGVVVTILWSGVVSFVVLLVLKKTIGLRVDESEEETGLDLSNHGEAGYSH